MHSGVLIHPLRRNGVDTMMTLDASKWDGTGGELSSCVINTSIRSCIIIFGTLSEQIYQLTFYPFCFMCLYICLCFLCNVICMHSFHSAHIFKVCNSVYDQLIQYSIMVILLNYTAILCTVH